MSDTQEREAIQVALIRSAAASAVRSCAKTTERVARASDIVRSMSLTELTLEIVEDLSLSPDEREQLRQLLASCFSAYEHELERTYFKQIPQRRLIARKDGRPVGHVGLEHRVVGADAKPLEILGLIDVCVHPSCRGQGIASQILRRVEELAKQNGVPFLMLFATDDRLYANNGFSYRRNRLTWLKIHEHRSLGSGDEVVDELMIKECGDKSWPDGPVDLLGYLF